MIVRNTSIIVMLTILIAGDKELNWNGSLDADGWMWKGLQKGGILRIRHAGKIITIER